MTKTLQKVVNKILGNTWRRRRLSFVAFHLYLFNQPKRYVLAQHEPKPIWK